MEKTESYTSNLLKIEVREIDDTIQMKWTGKSIHRKPSEFITPILVDLLKRSSAEEKRIILDFRKLNYMNSSTITPIIKILERAKRGSVNITVIYEKSVKWQDLSFSALEIFQTKDRRVQIKGVESNVKTS